MTGIKPPLSERKTIGLILDDATFDAYMAGWAKLDTKTAHQNNAFTNQPMTNVIPGLYGYPPLTDKERYVRAYGHPTP